MKLYLLPLLLGLAVLTGCEKKPTLTVGGICNPTTYRMRQNAIGEVFDVSLTNKNLSTALAIQRLQQEIAEVCTVAEQNRVRILVTHGAHLDSTGNSWVMPKVQPSVDALMKEIDIWASAPLPLTSKVPVAVHGLPEMAKVKLLSSGVILITKGLIDFGDLSKE